MHIGSIRIGLGLLMSLALSAHAADVAQPAAANNKSAAAKSATPRLSDGHPDLNGNWVGMTGSSGAPNVKQVDANGNIIMRIGFPPGGPGGPPPGFGPPGVGGPPGAGGPPRDFIIPGARAPGEPALPRGSPGSGERFPGSRENQPAYLTKEMQDKTDWLFDNGFDNDAVVTCGMPGLPRVGAPEKIVQTAKEIVFLYADSSSMVWRVIPTDGRGFRGHIDPSFYGDSIGHWQGDTLVVESINFVDETWFGEYGYFHTDQMKVTERLTRQGNTLMYQATVEDPGVLAKPWVKAPVKMTFTDKQIQEPFPCSPSSHDGGHHIQRIP